MEEEKWGFVRTNNSEWIADIHALLLEEHTLEMIESFASQRGKKLDKHYDCHCGEKVVWCYKKDVRELLVQIADEFTA